MRKKRHLEENKQNKGHHHTPNVHASCIKWCISSVNKVFSGSCQIKITKTRGEGLGERSQPCFIWQGHLIGHTAPGMSFFWGASKWTCQMPQTGNRKLLLNDVKYKRLFQVRLKLRYFVFPCMNLINYYRLITITRYTHIWWACTPVFQKDLKNYFD